ncbi:hypothetical protein [Actinomadura fulvescens]|uniref:hypothetical protein n=1 Tax=Actinomadura fulvescens TaxID=46160 RepID=UPI0031E32486
MIGLMTPTVVVKVMAKCLFVMASNGDVVPRLLDLSVVDAHAGEEKSDRDAGGAAADHDRFGEGGAVPAGDDAGGEGDVERT